MYQIVERLDVAKECYLAHPDGLSDIELAEALGVGRTTAWRYRTLLSTVEVSRGRYVYRASQRELDSARALLASQVST